MAVNCSFVPRAMLGFVGVTVIDSSVTVAGFFTVRAVVLNIFPEIAEMYVVPAANAETFPVLLIVAKGGDEDCQVTDVVIF